MPWYDEIKRLISEILPSTIDTVVMRLPIDTTAITGIVIAIIALVLPLVVYLWKRFQSAKQLRKIILAYLVSFEKKIDKVLQEKTWDNPFSFEEYNKKNYDILESILEKIFVLSKEEIDTYISFVVKFKTSDEMCLKDNYLNASPFQQDLLFLMNVIKKRIKKEKK